MPALVRWIIAFFKPDIRRNEARALFWSCAYFFFLLGSWYILRPIRDTMGVRQDIDKLPYLYIGTFIVTFAVTPPFSILVNRLTRRRFIPIVYRFFGVNILIFAWLLYIAEGGFRIGVYRAFFIWSSMFNMFAVSVFWGLMADIYSDGQGKRLFGFIAAGGTVGAIAGSFLTRDLVKQVGFEKLLVIAAVLLEVGVWSFYRLLAVAERDGVALGRDARSEERERVSVGYAAIRGIDNVRRSPYLIMTCLFMLLFTTGSTCAYFLQQRIIDAVAKGDRDVTSLHAQIDLYTNIVTLALQGLATGGLIKWLGMGATMAILPCLTCGGFVGLAMLPGLQSLMIFQVARRGSDYAISKPARDLLYTVVAWEQKYTSKSFIDTFVYRGGDALAAGAVGLISAGAANPALRLATAGAVVSALWIGVGVWLGRRQEKLAKLALAPVAPATLMPA